MQYFGSNIVEGVAESWVEVNGAGLSWVELDGARWRWVHGLVIPILLFTEIKVKLPKVKINFYNR